MTCLRARKVVLRVDRGDKTPQYPNLIVPAGWPREHVLEHARSVHEPLGHTVTVYVWATTAELWLANPEGFTDYATGELKGGDGA